MEKLKIKITIFAAIIVTAYAYFNNIDFIKTCYTIIITIIVFYLIGGFIEIFLQNQIDKIEEQKKQQELEENQENLDEEEAEEIEELDVEAHKD